MDIVELFKALSDENRLRILNLLTHGELCVCELETILDITQSNASRHLRKLKNSGLISAKKKAQWVIYSLKDEFEEKNKHLIQFIKDETANNAIFLEDLKRLNKYNNSCFDCECLREDMAKVKKYLEEGQ